MTILGVVTEYNPFHNGHLHHLEESRKKAKADLTIAVMSGTFLQRGEPALMPKWERARMALAAGADLVAELPYAFSSQKASTFANGAVSILEALGADYLCFGSEDGEIAPFLRTAEQLKKHEEAYSQRIKEWMKEGMSYPRALSLAFKEVSGEGDGGLADLSKPNNILGFQYISSICEQESRMVPLTIKRTAAGYHDTELPSGRIASATSLRKSIFSGDGLTGIHSYVPPGVYGIMQDWVQSGLPLMNWDRFFSSLQYTVLSMTADELSMIYEVEEGLENRIRTSIRGASSFQEFMERLKTKRYTWTRLQRMCVHVLTRTTKQEMQEAVNRERAPYIRILGMNEAGQRHLAAIKKTSTLPLVVNPRSFNHPALTLDLRAADIYAMGFPGSLRPERLRAEYATPPVRI
ncbi:nucleotidyltransferase [Bacillus mangrovi]|uniref:tRNA(Met) cytidine acetate ligase n=1 Tax=Metabacillus mangrovi TaxID=1491830 RepID=A0A7X2S3L0_9BACI|nr:nucleotidyltransferase [Metabacillus mangrovi]MTH52616.1 nucleotidyltransferase [Metabacillus mangrovi]